MSNALKDWLMQNLTFFEILGLVYTGQFGKMLLLGRPLKVKILLGELLICFVVTAALVSYGAASDMSVHMTVFLGSVVGLLGPDGAITLVKKFISK